MLYEMRVYDCTPGKMPLVLKRFETMAIPLWNKHGIKQAGFWTALIGESNQQVIYMLQWESLADREKKWTAFQNDPEWHEKRASTEKDGPLVARVSNQILQPTAFSSVK